jgi:hypothetical protein
MLRCAYSHRIERLIHLELTDRFGKNRVKKECQCGKIHRELFCGENGIDDSWNDIRDVIVHWVIFGRIVYGDIMV